MRKKDLRNIGMYGLLLLVSVCAWGQRTNIEAVNNYITFNNECTHGMLIVHRLLENFNQEVNKFVDLESQQVNFYSNKDLPQNLFEDPENWFYEISPYELYNTLEKQEFEQTWSKRLKPIAKQMRQTISEINSIRFEADRYISSNNLNEQKSQEGIYEILERGVTLFEQFYLQQKQLRRYVYDFMKQNDLSRSSIHQIHDTAYEMLEDLRLRDDNDWDQGLANFMRFDVESLQQSEQKDKLKRFLSSAREFIETAQVSPEYKLYGKYYFYHNSKLLNYVNRYGNGYVNAYNMTLNKESEIYLLEIPHFYQVIYPSKWMEDVPLASMDPSILELPERLKDRKVSTSDRIIYVDSEIVKLEFFDHQMIDGDIVSVNFNGDWILENHPLKGKPYPLTVKLNKTGKNYILLHAINLGKKPPNTMALRYRFEGENKTVVLTSNLDESEIIEVRLAK